MPLQRHNAIILAGLFALAPASLAPSDLGPGDKLVELRRITTPSGVDWLLRTGPSTTEPRNGQVLYIQAEGDTTPASELHAWHMPGKLIDMETREPFYEAEVFVGEVLPDTIGVIWFDNSLMPDGLWRRNTVLLDLNGVDPDTVVFFGHGRKSLTQRLAFQGKCSMLSGPEQRINP